MHILVGIVSYPLCKNQIKPYSVPSSPSLLRTISIKFIHVFKLRQSKRRIHTLEEMHRAPTSSHYPALLEHSINGTSLVGHSAEEDSFATINVSVYDFGQDLCAGAVDGGDPVDVEDDIFVVLRCSHARQGGVGGVGAVEFKSTETVFEISGVGKGEWFGYLDDQAAFDEFEGLRIDLCVLKLVLCAWYFAQDLYARFR